MESSSNCCNKEDISKIFSKQKIQQKKSQESRQVKEKPKVSFKQITDVNDNKEEKSCGAFNDKKDCITDKDIAVCIMH